MVAPAGIPASCANPVTLMCPVALAVEDVHVARALFGAPVAFPTFAHVVPDVVGVPDA